MAATKKKIPLFTLRYIGGPRAGTKVSRGFKQPDGTYGWPLYVRYGAYKRISFSPIAKAVVYKWTRSE